MEKGFGKQPVEGEQDITISMNHCVNTQRTYVYELRKGEIISQKTIHGTR